MENFSTNVDNFELLVRKLFFKKFFSQIAHFFVKNMIGTNVKYALLFYWRR